MGERYFAIGLVIIGILIVAFISDRASTRASTRRMADSLDSVHSGYIHHSVDSVIHVSDRNYTLQIMQIRRRAEFQDRQIKLLKQRLDSLIHGR